MKKKVIIIVSAIFVMLMVLGIIGSLAPSQNTNSSNETSVNETTNDVVTDTVQNKTETEELEEDAVIEIKEGHFTEYPNQPIGDAFDNFFENAKWYSEKGEYSTIIVFTGEYQDSEGKKTIGIQFEYDPAIGIPKFKYMTIGGAADSKESNIAKFEQYPQMMRAVFAGAEVPVVELSGNDDYNFEGMWIGKPLGQDLYSTEIIHIKNVTDDVVEFETAYCVVTVDTGWKWMIARSDEGTSPLIDSDISGVKCFYADGENVYIDDNDIYYGTYDSDNMKLYKTSFRSLEEVVMYYRSDYDVDNLRENKDDLGFVIANPIKTYLDEFAEVIPSQYDVVDPEWYKTANRFEYSDEYGFGHGVTFSITNDGLLGILFEDWDENGEYFTTLPEQQGVICYIDVNDYEVNSKNGLVYPLYTLNYVDGSENYNYLTYYSQSINENARVGFHIEDGMTPKYETYYAVGLVDTDVINIQKPEDSEENNNTSEEESGSAEIIFDPTEGEAIDGSWYKDCSHFQSSDGTILEIIYYDDGSFELAFDGLTADSSYSEYNFEYEGDSLFYKADEGIRFRYYPSKKMIEVIDAPYKGEYECLD